MVSKSSGQRKTIIGKKEKIIFLVLLFISVVVATLMIAFSLNGLFAKKSCSGADSEAEESAYDLPEKTEVEEKKEVLKIDFQDIVDEWVSSVEGNRSVLIYDLERDEIVGSYNPSESYGTASLYKLFVVYEGYKRLQSAELTAEETVGGTGHTVLECLDLAIRESYSPCAETLWGYIGHDELDEIIQNDFEITNSDISSLVSTPEDILKMMKIFYQHEEIDDKELIDVMKDSFLNQPVTTYDWRQGLPSGFTKANVYNKVGWDYNGKSWDIYHDAAIVEFPEDDRHFIVVVMTNQVPFQQIRRLGTMIENQYVLKNSDQ
ncbi:serine hydrolase [Candidatus Saccharibacteria bacterium]|nr:serine hydrolase [Candidatus Saccharibacteria bacterium]